MVIEPTQQLFFPASIVAHVISYPFKGSRLTITSTFKRQNAKHVDSNGPNFCPCQDDNSRYIHNPTYQIDISDYQD